MEQLSDEAFTQQVNGAFKNYHSILALSRSPLANSPLVAPALVRDAVSPIADERGHALRLVLQWAVERLAPAPPSAPFGQPRPYDDPAWRDPRWWRYTILRHRYIEPLHPDEFVEGGRYTETLIALTGIPSSDTFFEERNRAVREAAAWLRQQLLGGTANEQLRQMALDETLGLLRSQPAAQQLLAIAATFDEVFSPALLFQIAADERVARAEQALAYLTAHRLLLTDNRGADLWLSPVLRAYLYERQPAPALQGRHMQAARYYAASGDALSAAEHWQRAEQWPAAARALFAAAPELINELRIGELCDALARFAPGQLGPADWRASQIMLCDLSIRLGRRDEALAACRRALKATQAPAQQAQIYRRMGKLYEQHNQLHALGYYQQAEERFADDDPELVTMLKDRAWLYILRREWASAEADLQRALARTPPETLDIRADIFDALASLHRQQRRFAQAGEFAQRALALREELGSLPRIADSFQNLGMLYSAMADHPHAIAAFEEALAVYRRLGNEERSALTLLNIGMAYHLAERRREAIAVYRDCLARCVPLDLRLVMVRAHYNLAEALAELGELPEAAKHLAEGRQIASESAFDDELRDLELLQARFPALLEPNNAPPKLPPQPGPPPAASDPTASDPTEQAALALVARDGTVTAKALMASAGVSKATATRRLADMAQRGLLVQQGQGRATAYVGGQGAKDGRRGDKEAGMATLLSADQLALLRDEFALAGLGPAAAGAGPVLRLRVRFTSLPDLASFFALERRLSALLGQPVDLVLDQ